MLVLIIRSWEWGGGGNTFHSINQIKKIMSDKTMDHPISITKPYLIAHAYNQLFVYVRWRMCVTYKSRHASFLSCESIIDHVSLHEKVYQVFLPSKSISDHVFPSIQVNHNSSGRHAWCEYRGMLEVRGLDGVMLVNCHSFLKLHIKQMGRCWLSKCITSS
jgi:hypothetical protein